MKIYNEIVFDVDGNVTYEDSYEYSGDVVLCISIKDYIQAQNRAREDGVLTPEEQADLSKMLAAITGQTTVEDTTEEDIEEFGAGEQLGVASEQIGELHAQKLREASDIQLNPLPSLPSISNVGSAPFTGVVNWNAIPGGFQPLPQVGGGKKRIYQLSQFHGGINIKSSPRDISDQECQEAINISVSNIGRITLLGDCLNEDNVLKEFATLDGGGANLPGYGLFEFVAPADPDGTAGEEVILLTADGDQVDALSAGGGQDVSWIDFEGAGDDGSVGQIYYAAGNGVYVADASMGKTSLRAKIYVHREDFHGLQTTKGWSESVSKPLINSPIQCDSNAAGEVNLDSDIDNDTLGFSLAAAYGSSTVHIGAQTDVVGTWNGTYTFYISWLFDGGCETGLSSLSTVAFANYALFFNFSCKAQSADTSGDSTDNHIGTDAAGSYSAGDLRIEGARVYFKAPGGNERYLLGEVSLVDGVKGALDSTYQPWVESSNVFQSGASVNTNAIKFESPPEVYTYASLNGYYANEVYTKSPDVKGTTPTAHPLLYKTVVVGQNGIVYIGNVNFNSKHKPDSMMFSMPGKPAVFPKYNTFDSPSSDGSPITALAAFKDTILQFKQNGMYVINVSNPAQFYAQASFRDCGVFNPCQVFTTSFGVIFVNKNGCFIYDGQKVISLTNGKFDWHAQSEVYESTSNTTSAYVPCVGYDPRSQNIIVLKSIGHSRTDVTAWVYNMVTQSWTEGGGMITNADGRRHTNFIITSEGYLSIKRDNDPTLLNYNNNKAVDTGAQTITYQTKDFDFGLPSQTKILFKVYITFRGSPPSTINYRINGGDTAYGFTETNWSDAGVNNEDVATLVPDDANEAKGWTSISIYMTGAAGGSGQTFEINDIAILYRARPIK